MPGFFRGKRAEAVAESNSGRYLRYAIGEIFLIFIGAVIFGDFDKLKKYKIQ